MNLIYCDDSKEDREIYGERILSCAQEICPKAHLMTYESAKILLFHLEDNAAAIDILFLDIHLLDGDGVDLVEKIRKTGFGGEIIFLTVADDRMLDAFDVGAFNYIVKNDTTPERFSRVVRSAIRKAEKNSNVTILMSAGGENRNVSLLDIRYFQSVDHLIVAHYENERFAFYSTMGKLEARLRAYRFVRVHRSYLVSAAHVRSFTYKELVMDDGTVIPMGRGKSLVLKDVLGEGNDI